MAASPLSASGAPAPLEPLSVVPASLGSHLLLDEEVLSLCPSVGLYAGSSKLPLQQNGTAYLTSHRIIYIDDADPRERSGYLRLSRVKVTEYYSGFLKSSPKVILGIQVEKEDIAASHRAEIAKAQDELSLLSLRQSNSGAPVLRNGTPNGTTGSMERWVCPVCSFNNTSGAEQGDAVQACQLCGVKRDPSASTSMPSRMAAGSSLSTSSHPTSIRPPAEKQANGQPKGPEISCPTCTFFNHPSMSRCEVCDSPLGTESVATSGSTLQVRSSSPKKDMNTSAAHSAQSTPPQSAPSETVVKLSFRKGGDKAFYEALSHAMKASAWKRRSTKSPSPSLGQRTASRRSSESGPRRSPVGPIMDIDGRSSTPVTGESSSATQSVVGIDGLLNAYSNRSAAQTSDMSDALQDLHALMSRAKQMVDLAENLNAKLTRREAEIAAKDGAEGAPAPADDDETEAAATLIRSSLVRLGLPTKAITKAMAKSEDEYHAELARELGYILLGRGSASDVGLMGQGRVLTKGREKDARANGPAARDLRGYAGDGEVEARGIIGLDEVWVVWNRVRGVALLPPASLLSVATSHHLSSVTDPPICLRTLPSSGLKVLHTPRFADAAFVPRIVERLAAKEMEDKQAERMRDSDETAALQPSSPLYGYGLSTLTIARLEGISLLVAQELLENAEKVHGQILRDDQDGGGGGGGGGGESGFRAGDEAGRGSHNAVWYVNRFRDFAVP